MAQRELAVAEAQQLHFDQTEFITPAEDGIFRPDIESTDTVVLGPDISFVYVMRKDNRSTVEPMAEKLANQTGLDEAAIRSVLHEEYETFFAGLADKILSSMEYKRQERDGAIQLHIFDAEGIEQKALDRCRGAVVTADPLKVDTEGVSALHVSREYLMGGTQSIGLRNRPGSEPLDEQIAGLREIIGRAPTTFADDDTFTGGTADKLVTRLQQGGINVENIVFDIQMGQPVVLERKGIPTDAGITYLTHDGSDIMNISDLGDPRDFLVGASGLVVKMPDGHAGRVPYVLPFVSPAARMGIPQEAEQAFSEDVLRMNFAFYSRVSERLGAELTLLQMDDHFAVFMKETYGFDLDTPMTHVVAWAGAHMQETRRDIEEIGKRQSEVHKLGLPENLVVIDSELPADTDLSEIHDLVEQLGRRGIHVGSSTQFQLERLHPEVGTNPTVKTQVVELLQRLGHNIAMVDGGNVQELTTVLRAIKSYADQK